MKKLWFCGFVVLFLIIAPVAADICTPIPNTGFCTVDGTTKYTYNEIPSHLLFLVMEYRTTCYIPHQG